MRRSRITLALVLVSMIVALAPTLAPGDPPKHTRVSYTRVSFFPPPFHGALNATRYKCDVHRKIKIFRKSGRLVATTRSSGRGYFFVRRPNAHGYFYAKAMRERKKTLRGNHTLLCLDGTSRTRYFD